MYSDDVSEWAGSDGEEDDTGSGVGNSESNLLKTLFIVLRASNVEEKGSAASSWLV